MQSKPQGTSDKPKLQKKGAVPDVSESEVVHSTPIGFATGSRVQYLGTEHEILKGHKGTVLESQAEEGHEVVDFDGIGTPMKIPVRDLIVYDDVNVADPGALMTSKRPKARFVANTSGGLLVIPDLGDGFWMEAGEKADLLQYFTPQEINKSRGVDNAFNTTSDTTGLPQLVRLTSMNDQLPEGAIVIPEGEREDHRSTYEASRNEFDDKLEEDLAKEEERNEKLKGRRATRQHGRASQGLGRRG